MKERNPHPKSKEWKLRFRLRPYKGQILASEDMTTYQLITFTRWANEYKHWKKTHRITEPTMDTLVKDIGGYELELTIRQPKRRSR